MGAFDDLIPKKAAGTFDDLIPKKPAGTFDDLIPKKSPYQITQPEQMSELEQGLREMPSGPAGGLLPWAKRIPGMIAEVGKEHLQRGAQARVKELEVQGDVPSYKGGSPAAAETAGAILGTPKQAVARAYSGRKDPLLESAAGLVAASPMAIQAAGKLGKVAKEARAAREAAKAGIEAKAVAPPLGGPPAAGRPPVPPPPGPPGPPAAGRPPVPPPPGPPAGGPPQRPPIQHPAPTPPPGIAAGVQNAVTGVKKIFSPSTVDNPAKAAAGLLREKGGTAARDTAITEAALEQFEKRVNQMSELEQRDLNAYVEGRSKGAQLWDPSMKPIADQIRGEMKKREGILAGMKSTQQMDFIEDYLIHQWADPAAARKFYQGFAKQGSTGFTKKRAVPTYEDGIAAGLVPKSTNPIAMTMTYVANADRFIAANQVMDTARKLKAVKYFRPGSARIPKGYAALEGRLGVKRTPVGEMQAYAPEGFARVYNNFVDKGFHQFEMGGKVFDGVRKVSNSITSLELGLSGFHGLTIAGESFITQLAAGIDRAIGGLQRGSLGAAAKGLGTAAKAPLAPFLMARTGSKGQAVYLGKTAGSPIMRKTMDLLTKAGGRAVNFRHDPTYEFSAMKGFWNSWRKGALRAEARTALEDIKTHPFAGPLRQGARAIGRVMTDVAAPLFETYIPKVKTGAFHEIMAGWLEANPSAPLHDQVQAARMIWDSIDNRFGEMVHDNIFWNKMLKQSAQLAMRSYSWNLGTVSEIVGGTASAIRHPFSSLGYAGSHWNPKSSYVIALPIGAAMLNAAYQYIKTGKPPEMIQDLVSGRTGGAAPGVSVPSLKPFGRSSREEVPERAQLPGYINDVLHWYYDPMGTAASKIATLWTKGAEIARNQDFMGNQIINPEESVPQWLRSYMDYVAQSFGPISIRQWAKGEKEGSNISKLEQIMGIRPAAPYLQDPEGYRRRKEVVHGKEKTKKENMKRYINQQYGPT